MREIRMATISVPSSEPPNRITIPVPRPSKMPPNTKANKVSVTKGSTGCSKAVPIDMTVIPTKVEIAKVLPICLYPTIRKGRLKRNRKIPSGNLDK
ncbi:hypothetical protein D3C76_1572100 [compost metagenome]